MTTNSPSRAFWDSQLDNAANVPDFAAWPERYQASSAAAVARHGAPSREPVGAEGAALWRTATGGPERALVFIHGGYWRRYGAADFAFPVAAAAAAGAHFLNVDYRLMPAVPMAAVVEDARAACELALTGPRDAVVVGHSAGAHLAVEAALRGPRVPKAILALSGLYDLTPLRHAFIQDELALSGEDARAFSPLSRVADVPCPVHVMVGANESAEFRRQSAAFHDALAEAGRPATLTFAEGHHHSSIVAALAEPDSALSRQVAALLSD